MNKVLAIPAFLYGLIWCRGLTKFLWFAALLIGVVITIVYVLGDESKGVDGINIDLSKCEVTKVVSSSEHIYEVRCDEQ